MKIRKKYRIRIEDETHLSEVAGGIVTPLRLWLCVVGLGLLMLILAGALIAFTPLRTLLPGYLKKSERSATEEGLMRLDSLQAIYDANQAYIENFLRITDIERAPTDSLSAASNSHPLTTDSLHGPSTLESDFVQQMEEHERFNISVLAPLAADDMMFVPVSEDGVFARQSIDSDEAEILFPAEGGVGSVADGSIVASYYSPSEKGYVILAQHARGFLSQYSHTGAPMVGVGDEITAGQIIAFTPTPDSRNKRYIKLRLWHNGHPIHPYDYVGPTRTTITPLAPAYEAPRGN